MKRILSLVSILIISCSLQKSSPSKTTLDTIGETVYHFKDTVCTLYVKHYECVECEDALVDSGTIYIPHILHPKLDTFKECVTYLPYFDLKFTNNMGKTLFGDEKNSQNIWGNRYKIIGKVIDIKRYYYLFEIQDYQIAPTSLENLKKTLPTTLDTIRNMVYHIKDTTSTLYVSHNECTECKDAWVDSGRIFIPPYLQPKLHTLGTDERNIIPYYDIEFTNNTGEKLFGNEQNFMKLWHNQYKIMGKVVDIKAGYYLFHIEKYEKIGVAN